MAFCFALAYIGAWLRSAGGSNFQTRQQSSPKFTSVWHCMHALVTSCRYMIRRLPFGRSVRLAGRPGSHFGRNLINYHGALALPQVVAAGVQFARFNREDVVLAQIESHLRTSCVIIMSRTYFCLVSISPPPLSTDAQKTEPCVRTQQELCSPKNHRHQS